MTDTTVRYFSFYQVKRFEIRSTVGKLTLLVIPFALAENAFTFFWTTVIETAVFVVIARANCVLPATITSFFDWAFSASAEECVMFILWSLF